jgi:methyl-accepting chemotaxis protein
VNSQVIMTIFVVVAAIAMVLQLGTLFALFLALRKTSERLEAVVGRLESQTTPILATAHAILDEAQPKISEITSNLAESTATVRAHVAEMAEATTEIVGRARLQAERIDEVVGNTLSRIELTTEFVQQSVITPIRRIQAVVQAISAGWGILRANRSRRKTASNSSGADADEEMFI